MVVLGDGRFLMSEVPLYADVQPFLLPRAPFSLSYMGMGCIVAHHIPLTLRVGHLWRDKWTTFCGPFLLPWSRRGHLLSSHTHSIRVSRPHFTGQKQMCLRLKRGCRTL